MSCTIVTDSGSVDFDGLIAVPVRTPQDPHKFVIYDGDRPVDSFSSKGNIFSLLREHGYEVVGRVKEDPRVTEVHGYSWGVRRFEVRGFLAEVLTGAHHSPNGGVSTTAKQVVIVGDLVPESLRIFVPTAEIPAVQLKQRPWADDVVAVGPTPDGATIGPMASGAWLFNSDSRWRELAGSDAPIALHDRYESVELYNALSD